MLVKLEVVVEEEEEKVRSSFFEIELFLFVSTNTTVCPASVEKGSETEHVFIATQSILFKAILKFKVGNTPKRPVQSRNARYRRANRSVWIARVAVVIHENESRCLLLR